MAMSFQTQADCERELLKLCADKHSDITKIKHLLNQPAVDPNIYDEVFLEYYCRIVVQEFEPLLCALSL